ncbi:MAG: DUF3533 domain-containing protein [Chloroflexi bacterium]|uniref:DUF3533 domain-containing protein n=1 Tax=Candidatus Chlorohelix allophototropha TaxID=3003348 RepID=A0A8T7M6J2_9CHLR|nr:DUF3533 domain-containing protein [Chloroflexota bacterium]WJW69631.1 YhgE/Pip family protein [Chloroflexota bacterium L227-S17]
MIRNLFSKKLTWFFMIIVLLVAMFNTFSYLGAFLDPTDNTKNLPMAVINTDKGLEQGGTTINLGKQIVDKLLAPAADGNQTYKWTELGSRDEALAALNENKYFVALIIPADYSATLAALQGANPEHAAILEILTNQGAGTLGYSQAQGAATAVVNSLSKTTADQMLQSLTAAGAKLNPAAAVILGNPVQAKITAAVQVGSRSARGMSAFYLAMMLSLGAFLGTNILGTLIDLFSEHRRKSGHKTSPINIFYSKAILYTFMALVVAGGVTLMAVVFLDMDTPDGWSVLLFSVLGSLAVAEMSLLFQITFGRLGLLVGVMFFTILGVPASGGPYPAQMVPEFWRFLHGWLPMRYMTDGLRSLLFMNGNMDAGLGKAILALALYAVGGLLVAWLASHLIERHNVWEAADGLVDQLIEGAVETKQPVTVQ